jgi:hypothetical protein
MRKAARAGGQSVEHASSQAGSLVEAVFERRATGFGDQVKDLRHG